MEGGRYEGCAAFRWTRRTQSRQPGNYRSGNTADELRLQILFSLFNTGSDFRVLRFALRVSMNTTVIAGFREIWAHKFRSLLTMLGIILGVSSLVAMSALVAGMEKGAKEALVAIGGLEKVRIEPQEIPIEQRHLTDQAVGITINDVVALKESAPLVTRLSPEMRLPASLSANGKSF